ncbi:MAG: carbon-nitrogen hydrolase family protein [Thaumarchaeota archaeon]|nr:carbon-nitrogen hydrolase family protein [Nitrososphaerota archaeon]
MKVAAVQLGLSRNLDRAVAEADGQIRRAANSGARLVCLPEHWLLSRVLKPNDPILRRFATLSKDLDIYLNLGANFQKRGKGVFLTSPTFSPKGEIISRQDKVHLYRRENRVATPGSRFNLFRVDGFDIAVLVCHDLVFPEPARTVTLMGAELLLVPSLILAAGSNPWLAYLRARSLENRIPIVSPNAYAPPHFLGRSLIFDLGYDKKQHIMRLVERNARPGQTLVAADLDLRNQGRLRRERLKELRNSKSIDALYRASLAAR